MSRVRLSGVGFAHPDAPQVFSDVEIDLSPGWTALAGPNGAGKTTLLRLIAGELSPSRGSIVREPGAAIAFCRQAPEEPTAEVLAFAQGWQGTAPRMRARFGLDPIGIERWPTLSPGERQRWQIAAALDLEPDVLLLDEPTNHLDAGARDAMAAALSTFRGVGVIVAHDRAFLDALATRTLWIEDGRVTSFTGSYSDARSRMDEELARARHARREGKRELARLSRELDARTRRSRAADAQRSSRRRMKGPRDSDARGAPRKAKAELGAAAHARAVATMRARVERSATALTGVHARDALGGALFVDFVPSPRATLIRATLPALTAGARTLLAPTTLVIDRDARVHVAGDNGAGKTTLLRALIDRWTLPPDRLLVVPQELSEDARRRALDAVRALPPDERGRALSLVATLGVDPDRLLASSAPSPGEAKKLVLAEGLARQVWCVVLDEPTNHLDVPSIERLEAALAAYPGALLLVTHDARLAAASTRERWTLAGGRLLRSWE